MAEETDYVMQPMDPADYSLEREAQAWDEQADKWADYDSFSDLVIERLRALVPDLASRRALDWGCGAGALVALLAREGCPSVLGLDISPAMVEKGRARAAEAGVGDRAAFQCVVVDAETIQPLAGSCDLLVSGSVLHCVPDPAAMVRTLAAAVAPGGVVVHFVWQVSAERLQAAGGEFAYELHEGLTQEYLEAALRGAGLEQVAVEGFEFFGMTMLQGSGRVPAA